MQGGHNKTNHNIFRKANNFPRLTQEETAHKRWKFSKNRTREVPLLGVYILKLCIPVIFIFWGLMPPTLRAKFHPS